MAPISQKLSPATCRVGWSTFVWWKIFFFRLECTQFHFVPFLIECFCAKNYSNQMIFRGCSMAMNIILWHMHSQCTTYTLFPVDFSFHIPHLLSWHICLVIYTWSIVTYYSCIILFIHYESKKGHSIVLILSSSTTERFQKLSHWPTV